jgi:hypothetical protein
MFFSLNGAVSIIEQFQAAADEACKWRTTAGYYQQFANKKFRYLSHLVEPLQILKGNKV